MKSAATSGRARGIDLRAIADLPIEPTRGTPVLLEVPARTRNPWQPSQRGFLRIRTHDVAIALLRGSSRGPVVLPGEAVEPRSAPRTLAELIEPDELGRAPGHANDPIRTLAVGDGRRMGDVDLVAMGTPRDESDRGYCRTSLKLEVYDRHTGARVGERSFSTPCSERVTDHELEQSMRAFLR